MNDGISTIAKMEELFSEIKKLSEPINTTQNDLTGHRTAAAKVLASTEKSECLERFLDLNGLSILHQWLREVSLLEDASNSDAQELLEVLFSVFERLSAGRELSLFSGVKGTIKFLLDQGNEISNKALPLYEKWNSLGSSAVNPLHGDKLNACDAELLPVVDPACCTIETDFEEKESKDILEAKLDAADGKCIQDIQNDLIKEDSVFVINEAEPIKASDPVDGTASLRDEMPSGSMSLKHDFPPEIQERLPMAEVPLRETTGVGGSNVLPSEKCDVKGDYQHISVIDSVVDVKPIEACKEKDNSLSTGTGTGNEETISCDLKKSAIFSTAECKPQPEAASVCEMEERLHILEDVNCPDNKPCSHDDLLSRSGTIKVESHLSSFQTRRTYSEKEMRLKVSKRDTLSFGDSSKTVETKGIALAAERSKLFLDDDDSDALEVARLVAIEVEREVIDYREPFCSSSPDISYGDTREDAKLPTGEETSNGLFSHAKVTSGSESSASVKGDGSGITDDSSSSSGNCAQDETIGSPVERSNLKFEKESCELDLNVNYSTEDTNVGMKTDPSNSVDSSAPIRVAASRGSSVIPAIPPQFEGKTGWKGSAATSAFRRASPRRSSEGNTSPPPEPREKVVGIIDLNILESEDDAAIEQQGAETLPNTVHKSVESTVVLGAKAEGGLKFDLNSSCEESAINCTSMLWNDSSNNSNSLLPAPVLKQPALRNIDLNDEMSGFDGTSSCGVNESSSNNSLPYGAAMPGKSTITIMGSKIVINSSDRQNHFQQPFLNGVSVMENRVSRNSDPYSRMPPSGYGIASYPGGPPALHYIQPFYGTGSTPYAFDLISPAAQPFYGFGSSSTHFVPGTSNAPSSSFRPSLDVNYGIPSVEFANKEGGEFRPFFLHGQTAYLDEHARNISQAPSAGMPVKRKEPDSGWDPPFMANEHLRTWR